MPKLHAFFVALITSSSLLLAQEPVAECTCSPTILSKAFTHVAKVAIPAVVFIKAQNAPAPQEDLYGINPFQDDFFQRFFGMPPHMQPRQGPQISQGSGFLVSQDGYILTNAHVVRGADKITVIFNDERELDATLVGSDPHTDIAIIKVEGKNFPFIEFGDSDAIEVGEWVVAIGSPFQLQASVTVGIVSAKGRQDLQINDFEDFIQTDAAINPGNSGGPLLNLFGRAVGVNAAILSRNGGYMGIGFSIPIKIAAHVMQQLIDKGIVTRGFLGISMQPIDKDLADAFKLERAEGALITEVVKGSPADQAGLKQGDIILEYNQSSVKSLGSLRNDISMMPPGSKVYLKINRKGKVLNIPVIIGSASDTSVEASGIAAKLGLEVNELSIEDMDQLGYNKGDGVMITKVRPGSPAAMVGIRPGFLIQSVNHTKVTNMEEFNKAVADAGNQKRILLLIRQGKSARYYTFKVE